MNKVKVFISYCVADNDKMEFIKNLINESEKLEAVVVLQQKSDLMYSPEKIIKALNTSTVFIPILTSNSYNQQWINQEIGFVYGKSKIKLENIKPIIDKKIASDLKGFISSSNDLNYRYNNNSDFKIKAKELVDTLIVKFKHFGDYYVL